jgi:hypothetical protein
MKHVLVAFLVAACGTAKPGGPGGPTMNNKIGGANEVSNRSEVVSWDVLDREPVANEAKVKHILIAWRELKDNYPGDMDPRAAERGRRDAEGVVSSLVKQIKAGADFDILMKANSEDSVSARSGDPIKVTPDAGLVIEFRLLSLRLEPGEVGVCQSDFGFHIIKRLS